MFKVRTYNRIAIRGLDRFDRRSFEVGGDIGHPDAFLIRSQALHELELPGTLLAIARAGAGVNNVPLARCSAAGIVVFNTPGANANAVKELVVAGMLMAARGIVPGIAYVDGLASMTDAAEMSALLEREKARFAGFELKGRTLGIVGLGAIGSMVADVHRIMTRGGTFMYPVDAKCRDKGGRLRLMYEANPMAFLVEQAGGAATTGTQRMLEVTPTGLHQRVPVILGSKNEVAEYERYVREG